MTFCFVRHFQFSFKKPLTWQPGDMHLALMICPREEDLVPFSQEIHCLLKHCEMYKKGQFKH